MPSGEDDLITRHFKPLARDPAALGLTDDAAMFSPPPGTDLVLTTDALTAGVHFFADDPPDTIARKALRVNLSDLAAKGATPSGFLLTLALPQSTDEAWLSAFARGLGEDAEHFGCPLLGGDTIRSTSGVTVSITALGAVPKGTMVRRRGAKPGDRIFASGTIGDAALGLRLRKGAAWTLEAGQRDALLQRYLLPQPRLALAEAVRSHATAAMDVSDGLAGDLTKLCEASNVGASVEAAKVPLSASAEAVIAADAAQHETALTGGDDYEILCTVAPAQCEAFIAAARAAAIPVTEIGVIESGEGVRMLDVHGKPLRFARASFSHF